MKTCRVFLFTYNRNALLRRSIDSLLAQKFTNWICEVHNDCPTDSYPERYIRSLNDPRFVMRTHCQNLGPTASFNLAFGNFEENYGSILEDDNWWEPTFLEVLIDKLESNPGVKIGWSNMNIWKELPGNNWENTNKTVWNLNKDELFYWPDFTQALGAFHSNGAMIYKSEYASNYRIPDNCLFDAVELIRERTFAFPLYFVSKPLANFSQTIVTSRSKKNWEWTSIQTMLLASFVLAAENPIEMFKTLLQYYKRENRNNVIVFFLSVQFYLKVKALYKSFTIKDWLRLFKWSLRNYYPVRFYLMRNRNVYSFLQDKTMKICKTQSKI